MRVLVTGAASGLGAALSDAFEARGDQVLRTDVRGLDKLDDRGTLRLDKETQAALSRVRSRADAVERLADDVRHVMVGLARLQRATNERIFAELGAPERPTEALGAPERIARAPSS